MNIDALKDQARKSKTKLDVGVILEMLTNPKDKEKLQNAIKEMSNSMTRIDAEKDLQKDIIEKASDDTGVDKKYIKKLAAIYHKQTFTQVQTEREEIEDLYESLFG